MHKILGLYNKKIFKIYIKHFDVNLVLDNKQIALEKQIPNRKWSQTKKIEIPCYQKKLC